MTLFVKRIVVRAHGVLIRLYPREFREEFGEEMREVFIDTLDGEAARGWAPVLRLALREIGDWPGALLQAYWHAIRKETIVKEPTKVTEVDVHALSDEGTCHAASPWREAVLAGVPHVLLALTIQAVSVALAHGWFPVVADDARTLQGVGGGVFVVGLAAALLIAWRQDWPRWSSSWLGYVPLLLMLLVLGALKLLESALGDWMVNNLGNAFVRLLGPLVLATGAFALALRDRRQFLLAVLPAVILGWSYLMEFTSPAVRAFVSLLAWLGVAGVAVLIARVGGVRSGLWITLAFSLTVGLLFTYARTYHASFPPGAPAHYDQPPTLLKWLSRFAPHALGASVLMLEPLVVQRLRDLSGRSGRLGALGFRLCLVGLLLLLVAELTASWWLGSGSMFVRLAWGPVAANGFEPSVPAYAAGLLCLSGVVCLGLGLGRDRPSLLEGTSLLAAFLLTAAPFVLALPMAYGVWDTRGVSRMWMYGLGVPWLALGVWLIAGRRNTGIPRWRAC